MFLLKSLLGDLLEKNTTSAFHVDHTLLLRLRKLAVLTQPLPCPFEREQGSLSIMNYLGSELLIDIQT